MTMRIEWRNGASTLPDGATLLVAFPGVANLGKVAVDSIGNLHDGVELARLHPIGLPPHAELDEDGLLAPPHYSLRRIDTETGHLLTLTGKAQPNEPGQQSTLADELMTFFITRGFRPFWSSGHDRQTGRQGNLRRGEFFLVPYRHGILGRGCPPGRTTFRRHRLGRLARIHGPTLRHELRLVIATTVGNSEDILGSQRLIEHLEDWFNFGLTVPKDGDAWLRQRLEALAQGQGRPRQGNDGVA